MVSSCAPSCCLRPGYFVGRVVFLITALTLAAAAGDSHAEEGAKAEQPLPLKRVVLFSSSVGFFEHAGQVKGNRQVEFSFKSSDINDLLKSLVVQDRNGGLVTAVNYGSPEPIAQTLRTFTIDLTDSPSLAQIFQQLRGQKVELETPAPVSGTVVGVETRKVLLGDKQFADVEVLNLRTDKGLVSVRVESIERTNFVDAKINAEFQKALELLASDRADEQKRVKLDFRGAGQREVSVGYIQEAPVWKTSYRLVLKDDEQPPLLQGWAIVENTTAHDWSDVQLTLVSGRPISFVMDLDQPLFMARPFVTPELHASLRPRVYEQDLTRRDAERMAIGQSARGRRGASGSFGSAGGAGGGGMGGSFGGGFGGGMGVTPSGGAANDPFDNPGVDGEERKRNPSIDLNAGVTAAASGEDVGELFRYVIKAPVNLARNESAMLPIVNEAVKAEKLLIFNPSVHAKHPLAGLRLTNTTALHLLQGPITLFDGDEYAGDARIEDVPPGSTRLISYALDLETEIVAEVKPTEQKIATLQIREGGLHVKQIATRATHYTIKNSSDAPKQILIERPIAEAWRLVAPATEEQTRSLRRFKVSADAGKPTTLVVTEDQDVTELFALTTLEVARLQAYLEMRAASPDLKKALQQAIDLKSIAADLTTKRVAGENRLAAAAEEQERTRKNLYSVPTNSPDKPDSEENVKAIRALRQRYLMKLADLENEIEKLHKKQEEVAIQEAAAKEEADKFLKELVVD
jgi:hypothetical protein